MKVFNILPKEDGNMYIPIIQVQFYVHALYVNKIQNSLFASRDVVTNKKNLFKSIDEEINRNGTKINNNQVYFIMCFILEVTVHGNSRM